MGGFYKLVSATSSGACVVFVNGGGVFVLDGVVVSHAVGYEGRGVWVYNGGHFVMYRGEISGNSAPVYDGWLSDTANGGGGVCNSGVFEMYGGVISGNTAGSGGGVYADTVRGTFKVYGGKITGNTPADIVNGW